MGKPAKREAKTKARAVAPTKVIGTGVKIFADEDNDFVMQFINEDCVVVAETKLSREMSDVVLAYMMYAQGAAFGMHPKSGWIH